MRNLSTTLTIFYLVERLLAGSQPLQLPDLISNHIQCDSYIGTTSSTAIHNNIFSAPGKGPNSIYTVADAVGKLGTSVVYNEYSDGDEPSLDRFLPNHGVPLVGAFTSIAASDLDAPDNGYTATYGKVVGVPTPLRKRARDTGSGGSDNYIPAIKSFARDDSSIKTICAAATAATEILEQKRGSLQKTLFIIEKDVTLTDGTTGEMLMTFESLASPIAGDLKSRCVDWVGDLIAWNTNYRDMSVVAGWRVIGSGSKITRLGLQINSKLSH